MPQSCPKDIQAKLNGYPLGAKNQLLEIRQLILSIASNHTLGEVEETLKWNEPSYSVKGGSPIRTDWKEKTPEYVYLFLYAVRNWWIRFVSFTATSCCLTVIEPFN